MISIGKKSVAYIVLMGALVLGGLGCKGTPQSISQKVKPVTLEYWTVYDDVDALQSLADSFKVSHPYVTLKIRQFRADEIYTQFVNALAEDKGPDIISVQDRSIGQYASKLSAMPSSVEDVTVTVVKGQFSNQVNYGDQMIPLPNVTQMHKDYVQAVNSSVIRGNKIYGLPLSFDTMALYYNKDLLDRAGIAEPPKDWNEFVDDVKKLTKFDKANNNKILQAGAAVGVGENVPGSDDLLYLLFRQSDVPFETSAGQVVFDNGASAEGVYTVVDFYTDFANPTRDRYTWSAQQENALDSFTHGTLAFFFGYNYHYPIIVQRAPQINFDVVPMPQLKSDKPINVSNFWIQAVPAKSHHSNLAWDFINYITHTGTNKLYLDRTQRPAALRNYLSGQIASAGSSPTSSPAALGVFASGALTAETWYKGANYDAAKSALNDMLREWVQIPDPSQENGWKPKVLNRAASRINQTLQ